MLYISLQSNAGNFLGQLPLIIALIGIFWYFFIRPSNKKAKEQEAFLTSIEKGNEVVTSSGIIGKVSKITDKDITLQVSEKNFIKMTKGSVSNELTNAYHKVEEKKDKK